MIYQLSKESNKISTYLSKKKKTQPITVTKYESQSNKHNTSTTH